MWRARCVISVQQVARHSTRDSFAYGRGSCASTSLLISAAFSRPSGFTWPPRLWGSVLDGGIVCEMTKHEKDASIVAHKEKASELRTLASQLNLKFSELDVPGNDKVIRFTFEISDEDLTRLLQQIPRDVFAYQALIGGYPEWLPQVA